MLKVLVTGGRTYHNPLHLWSALNALRRLDPDVIIIHGDARGADRSAGEWARLHGCEERRYSAQWDLHGRAAGMMRNRDMYEQERPDVVVVCPGGRGTAGMARLAFLGGTPIMRV